MMTRRKESRERRFSLDVLAWMWWLAGGIGTAGTVLRLATGPTGEPPWWARDCGAVEALGWSALVLWLGWAVVGIRLVVRRCWPRVIGALFGWTLLTLVAAVLIDVHLDCLPHTALAGPGGSVGAYLRFLAEDAGEGELLPLHVAALCMAFLALLLAADRWLRRLARGLWLITRTVVRSLLWLNERFADINEQLLLALISLSRWLGRFWQRGPTAAPPAPPVSGSSASPSHPTTTASRDTVNTIPIATPSSELGEGSSIPSPVPPLMPAVADGGGYPFPPLSLLRDPEPFSLEEQEQKLREMAALLEKTCQDFGITIKVVGIHTGPVITQYEVALETGLRLNKVTALADDLALNLKVPSVRVVAPLPGRNTVGIEVPNEVRQTVRLKEVVAALAGTPKVSRYKLPIFLGKDVEGRPLAYDLAAMPHLLIAGRTGTGKSVCLNTIIVSLLLTRSPQDCRMILIDPKKVELSDYARIPHLMTPVVTDEKKAEAILAWAVEKMEERYEWLHRARVRNIAAFNELGEEEILRRVQPSDEEERRALPRRMPYIVIVIDEVADLILRMKKEIEGNIILLAQKSRAAGIHLVLATQKPTVDVVTGLIKSNLPARICFQVASRSDSAVVLDEKGAERLLGHGDMLFLQPGTSTILRAQGALIEDQEIEQVVQHIATDTPNYDSELLNLRTRESRDNPEGAEGGLRSRDRDPLYEQAVEIVLREQRGSTSLLQRALGIGYGKAARFIDYMAEDGIVGPYNGSSARQVLISYEQWQAMRQMASAEELA
jgi:S-DNA-T family DNA segregation ATPase FtsK/SpoIIIE